MRRSRRTASASKRCSTISLPAVVVADANVVLSALIGGRARLVFASADGPRCLAVDVVAVEIVRRVPRLAAKRKLDPALLFAALQVMPIEWKPASDYEDRRVEAENRIAARDPDDWPTLALAWKLGVPVWSQDKDFSDAGVEVVTTGELLDALVLRATSGHRAGPSSCPRFEGDGPGRVGVLATRRTQACVCAVVAACGELSVSGRAEVGF